MKTQKQLRAIVIDAVKHEVREEKFSRPSLEYLQNAVGGYIELAQYPLLPAADLYVDEEGLLKDPKNFFVIAGYRYAGNGVIVGCDGAGKTISAPAMYTVDQVKTLVRFETLKVEQER